MKKGNKVLGIIGAFVGGMIGVIPWIVVYVYGNIMFLAFALLIAYCAFKGFTFCEGVKDKYLSVTITSISIFVVTLTTFLFIPFAMLYKEGFEISWYNFQILYQESGFVIILIRNYILALFFTIIGIVLIQPSIQKLGREKYPKDSNKKLATKKNGNHSTKKKNSNSKVNSKKKNERKQEQKKQKEAA